MVDRKLRIESLNEKSNAEFVVLTNLLYFSELGNYKYLINNNWGTKSDWKKYLWHNQDSTFIRELIDELIDNKILKLSNNKIIKNNVDYEQYVLSRNWRKIAQSLYIEKHFVVKELESIWDYSITRP